MEIAQEDFHKKNVKLIKFQEMENVQQGQCVPLVVDLSDRADMINRELESLTINLQM